MKNIEFKALTKFGETFREQFNGRKFSRLVVNEAKDRNISIHQVLEEFAEQHYLACYSTEPIIRYEFTWLDEFNHKHSIVKQLKH